METPAIPPLPPGTAVRSVSGERRGGRERSGAFERELGREPDGGDGAEAEREPGRPLPPKLQRRTGIVRRDERDGSLHVDVLA